jgi:hypothetical protein
MQFFMFDQPKRRQSRQAWKEISVMSRARKSRQVNVLPFGRFAELFRRATREEKMRANATPESATLDADKPVDVEF